MLVEKSLCSGCGACVKICPKNIISLERDNEGFLYPTIHDEGACIKCDLCRKVCPADNKVEGEILESYYAQNKDKSILMNSTSGGVVSDICSSFLKEKGIVWGVEIQEDWKTRFVCISRKEEIQRIRGSKYVECIEPIPYLMILEQLKNNHKVCVFGTPCQIKAVYLFIKIKNKKLLENLFLVDLFCYGVQSNFAWEKYLEEINPKHKKLSKLSMRKKEPSWEIYSMEIYFDDHTVYRKSRWQDAYLKSYSKGFFNRPSCSNCSAKSFPKVSDLTLGDFWSLDGMNLKKEIQVKQGVSIILIHSEKGKKIFSDINESFIFSSISEVERKKLYPNLGNSNKASVHRDDFMKELENMAFSENVNRFTDSEIKKKIMFYVKKPLKRKLKKIKHGLL